MYTIYQTKSNCVMLVFYFIHLSFEKKGINQMKHSLFFLRYSKLRSLSLVYFIIFILVNSLPSTAQNQAVYTKISVEVIQDKIRGGLLGQILGNLNGLEHENKYIAEPGNVTDYLPSLPEGARTDDDTDFEWVYIVEMQNKNQIYLSQDEIASLWINRINKRIWCSNQYARQLMDIGLKPPLTGKIALNPWADFNISGQFLCETFGLLAPAMPQTASKIGLHYTTVAIDLEPAQTTQLFDTMIATAFVSSDVDEILDAGISALDKKSKVRTIIWNVRNWHKENPNDWRITRKLIQDEYTNYNGSIRDFNGYELNTAAAVAAFLYGNGDFITTLQTAYNLGWDCDNTAATAGTIIGVMKGYRYMMSQNWQIVDRYHNTTRDNMPMDETITSFADRLYMLSERVVFENGGTRIYVDGRPYLLIPAEEPKPVHSFQSIDEQTRQLVNDYKSMIDSGLLASDKDIEQARSAYLAICLDMADTYQSLHPEKWQEALNALNQHWNVVQAIYYHANFPAGDELRKKANSAGLRKPAEKKALW